jgi:hypothetical protein
VEAFKNMSKSRVAGATPYEWSGTFSLKNQPDKVDHEAFRKAQAQWAAYDKRAAVANEAYMATPNLPPPSQGLPPDTVANATLNHGENKSDLARHLNHQFGFARDKTAAITNPDIPSVPGGPHSISGPGGTNPAETHVPPGWPTRPQNKGPSPTLPEMASGPTPSLADLPSSSRGYGEGLGFGESTTPSFFGEPAVNPPAVNPPAVRGPGVYISAEGPPRNTYAGEWRDMTAKKFAMLNEIKERGARLNEIKGGGAVIDEAKHGLGVTYDIPQAPPLEHPGFSYAYEGPPSTMKMVDVPPTAGHSYADPDVFRTPAEFAPLRPGYVEPVYGQDYGEYFPKGIRDAADQMNRGTTISGKMLQSMINRGGRIGKFGTYILENGQKISGGVSIAGGALAAAGIAYGGVQLHKMHKYRAELRSIADEHPDDQQIQEFFKINDEQTKRNDVYFGLNTAVGTLGIAASAAGATAALGSGAIAAGAAALAGPIGMAALGIGMAVWMFTSLFESGAKKRAYREYMSKVYGSADAPSLDYYLDHKDPELLRAVNDVKNYKVKDEATDDFKTYVAGLKGDIAQAEASIKIEEGVDDPRRAQLASILTGTVPPGELDKTSDFISRQHAQDVQNGQTTKTWAKDDIVNHAKKQFHSDMDRYARRDDPNLGPDTVDQTEQDYYDYEDSKNGTETHRWGYGKTEEDTSNSNVVQQN